MVRTRLVLILTVLVVLPDMLECAGFTNKVDSIHVEGAVHRQLPRGPGSSMSYAHRWASKIYACGVRNSANRISRYLTKSLDMSVSGLRRRAGCPRTDMRFKRSRNDNGTIETGSSPDSRRDWSLHIAFEDSPRFWHLFFNKVIPG
jgi:hypothetical protein